VGGYVYKIKSIQTSSEVDGGVRVEVHGVRYIQSEASTDPHHIIPAGCEESGELSERELKSDAVILATGGFSNDHNSPDSLIKAHAPHLLGIATTNGQFATGDGVKMASAIGALLVDMDKLQLHPTGFIDPKDPGNATKFLGPEALRGSGGVLINTCGQRFVNELDLRSVVSNAIIDQKDVYPGANGAKFAFCVLNEAAMKLFGPAAMSFYKDKQGLVSKVADLDGLAEHIHAAAVKSATDSNKSDTPSQATIKEQLTEALSAYEKVAKSGKGAVCPTTNKSVFPCVVGTEGPFYVSLVTPSIHYTMGRPRTEGGCCGR
jgi:succinate dehydrogenase/fumarate reductase flavoprotein subunit